MSALTYKDVEDLRALVEAYAEAKGNGSARLPCLKSK